MTAARIGLISISDRASTGVYEDKGLPALQDWLTGALASPFTVEQRLIADEQAAIEATLRSMRMTRRAWRRWRVRRSSG